MYYMNWQKLKPIKLLYISGAQLLMTSFNNTTGKCSLKIKKKN